MSSTKNILLLFFALLAIAGGVGAWNQNLESIRLNARLRDATTQADLQKQLDDSTAIIKALRAQLAALQAQLGPPGAPAPEHTAQPGAGQPGLANIDATVEETQTALPAPAESSTDVQHLTPAQVRDNIQAVAQAHAPLFAQLNLTPEQTAQFTSLLTTKQEAALKTAQGALQQGLDPEAVLQMVTNVQASVNGQIQTQFGDAIYSQYQQYEQTFPQRNTIDQLGQMLASTDTPLSADQSKQMVQLLANTQLPDDGGSLLRHINGSINFHSRISGQTLNQAASVLSVPQLQALQNLQLQQPAPVK